MIKTAVLHFAVHRRRTASHRWFSDGYITAISYRRSWSHRLDFKEIGLDRKERKSQIFRRCVFRLLCLKYSERGVGGDEEGQTCLWTWSLRPPTKRTRGVSLEYSRTRRVTSVFSLNIHVRECILILVIRFYICVLYKECQC